MYGRLSRYRPGKGWCKMTQCDLVLKVLRSRKHISSGEIYAKLNGKVRNITGRVSDLRKKGHVIINVRPGCIDPYKHINHTKINQLCFIK
jgi:hypothetical protein